VRQRQYIGKLMRELDPELVVDALEERDRRRALDTRRQKRIEQWRRQLLDGGAATLDDLLATYPRADRAALADLIRAAADMHGPEASRITAARELFRALRELESGAAALNPGAAANASDGGSPNETPRAGRLPR
jgi:ribosome-associated protein